MTSGVKHESVAIGSAGKNGFYTICSCGKTSYSQKSTADAFESHLRSVKLEEFDFTEILENFKNAIAEAFNIREDHCPKCNSTSTSKEYCDACQQRSHLQSPPFCSHGDKEHFHHFCRTCKYHWRMEIPNAKVICND